MRLFLTYRIRNRANQRGALMAAALMMMVVVGIMLSGWVAIMATRAQQVTYMEDAVKRRQSLANSKVLSRQLLLERGFAANSTVAAGWNNLLQDGEGKLWGGLQVTAGWSGNAFETAEDSASATMSYPFNPAGLTGGEAYLARRFNRGSGAMGDQMDEITSYQFLKMACPPLRGDLFTVYQRPPKATDILDVHINTTDPSGGHFAGWVVNGRMVIKDLPSLFSDSTPNPLVIPAQVKSLYIPEEQDNFGVVGTNHLGQRIPASNLAGVPMTVGSLPPLTGGLWDNQLNVVRNEANPANSIWHFMEREQSAGRQGFVTVDSVNYSYGGVDPPLWIEKQVNPPNPADPLAPPTADDEVEGLTYAPPEWPKGYPRVWRVLFVKLDHPDLPHVRILGGVDQVVFLGQPPLSGEFATAGLMSPVMVAIEAMSSGPGVLDIRFKDVNNRRWVLGIKSEIGHNMELFWEGNPILETPVGGGAAIAVHDWRLIMVNEFRTIYANIYPNRNVRITGGLMTNWIFKRRRSTSGSGNARNVAIGALSFAQDLNPEPDGAAGPKFSSLLPRDAWLETYFYVNQP